MRRWFVDKIVNLKKSIWSEKGEKDFVLLTRTPLKGNKKPLERRTAQTVVCVRICSAIRIFFYSFVKSIQEYSTCKNISKFVCLVISERCFQSNLVLCNVRGIRIRMTDCTQQTKSAMRVVKIFDRSIFETQRSYHFTARVVVGYLGILLQTSEYAKKKA